MDLLTRISDAVRVWVDTGVEVETSRASLDDCLASVLELLRKSPERWILIIDATPVRYVQVIADEDHRLYAECVSDEHLDGSVKLEEWQNELLPSLGWEWPCPPHRKNWSFHDELLDTGHTVATLTLKTLAQVFGLAADDTVEFKAFRSWRSRKPLTTYDHVGWDEAVRCERCGWHGHGSELAHESFREVMEVNCPECDARIQLLSFPTNEETEEAAAAGNPEAITNLLVTRCAQYLRRSAPPKTSDNLPPPVTPRFSVVLDNDEEANGAPTLWVRDRAHEVWRTSVNIVDVHGLCELVRVIGMVYGRRLVSLEVTDRMKLNVSGDDVRGPGVIDETILRSMGPRETSGTR
jgi:hypothetical protein